MPSYKHRISLKAEKDGDEKIVNKDAKISSRRKKHFLDTRNTKSNESIIWYKFDLSKVDPIDSRGLKVMNIEKQIPDLFTWKNMTWCQNLKRIKIN